MYTNPIYVVTSNLGKVQEIQAMLPTYRVCRITDVIPEFPEIEEDGITFEENAVKKVMAMPMLDQAMLLADDSGICVSALDGRPGIYSARYPGNTSEEKCRRLLAEVGDAKDRRAYFYCAIAVRVSETQVKVFSGRVDGSLSWSLQGDNGFGYDPIFIPEGMSKTIAALTGVQKNALSHRYRALVQLQEFLTVSFGDGNG